MSIESNGRVTPRGVCRCTYEQGDSYCDVHPRCDYCGTDLENLTAYTTGGMTRYCETCYHAANRAARKGKR